MAPVDILVLDDVELNNLIVAGALDGLDGCRIATFTEPGRALARLREAPDAIGLAVTDYDMPGMNGIAFIRAARATPGFEHTPLVMVTSMEERRIRRDALEAGATDFMTKPVDAVEIRARARNLLALHLARREQQDRAAWLEREVAAAVSVIEAREREIVTRLVRAAEHRDTDTGDHVSRVAGFVRLIARGLGLDERRCRQLAFASTMHDIGKIAVPDSILLKAGPLTPEERRVVQEHAESGHRILEGSDSEVVSLAADIAVSHHEHWDGRGYPRGLAGDAIPLGGRIVAVADVFDALVNDRPYKKAWAPDDARDYLVAKTGTQFDPLCVQAFLAAWDEVASALAARSRR